LAAAYANESSGLFRLFWRYDRNHCLSGTTKQLSGGAGADGSLFRSLEAAALSGADWHI
jgi:hypothetical protein